MILPPLVVVVLIHASSANCCGPVVNVEVRTLDGLASPANVVAVSASPIIAPAAPRVTVPEMVPVFAPAQSFATVPLPSPSRQYNDAASSRTPRPYPLIEPVVETVTGVQSPVTLLPIGSLTATR